MKELVNSKKFWLSVLGAVIVIGLVLLGYDVQTGLAAASPFIAGTIGQGLADIGKEKAKVEAEPMGEEFEVGR